MMLATYLLAWTLIDAVWYLFAFVAFGVALVLMGLILIQDSKDSGLTSAFGGGSSSSLMGARMQKDLAKLTGVLGIMLAICLLSMGLITAKTKGHSIGADGATAPPPNKTEPSGTAPGNPLGLGGPGGLQFPSGLGGLGPLTPNPVTPNPVTSAPVTPGGGVPGVAPSAVLNPAPTVVTPPTSTLPTTSQSPAPAVVPTQTVPTQTVPAEKAASKEAPPVPPAPK